MKKRILTCLAALCSLTLSMSGETVQTLMINGEKVEKTVTSMHFEGDNVVLHFGDETSSHDMSTVTLSFAQSTSIDEIGTFTFNGAVTGSTLTVSGVAAGTPVNVYTISGLQLASALAGENGEAAVEIGSLQPGVYVLQAGKNVVKFVKR